MIRYNSTTQNAEVYQGTTASWNTVPGNIARVDLTGRTAAISNTTIFTPTTSDMYMVCTYLDITHTGTSGNITVGSTFMAEAGSSTGTLLAAMSITAGDNWTSDCIPLYLVANTAFTYNTTLSGTAGSLAYTLHIRVTNMH
jgi:hypothetical protein